MARNRLTSAAIFGVMLIGLIVPGIAQGKDQHVKYYYPQPEQIEFYKARADAFPDATPARRIGFVTAITVERLNRPYPPSTVFFAKGDKAEKLIIVALQDGYLDTIYRVRAYLASLTAVARTTPAFRDTHVSDALTFFDLARMLGFEQITVSDGKSFSHQIKFK